MRGPRARRAIRAALLAPLVLAWLLGGCETCECGPTGAIPWIGVTDAETPAPTASFPGLASVAVVDAGAVLLQAKDGRVLYAAAAAGWAPEEVSRGASPGTAVGRRDPVSGDVVAAWIAPTGTFPDGPALAAPDDAPAAPVEGEGDLVLARRRAEGLWRVRVLAHRALPPALAVGSDGSEHLAFLQPSGPGYTVVYLRLTGPGLAREEAGHTLRPQRPDLSLRGTAPAVAWIDQDGRPILAEADTDLVFTSGRIDAALLGEPEAPVTALAFDRTDPLRLAVVRPVRGRNLELGGRSLALPRRAKPGANLVFTVDVGDAPRPRLVAVAPAGPVRLGFAGDLLAAAVGHVPLEARDVVDVWRPAAAFGGTVDTAAVVDGRLVYARLGSEGIDLWVRPPPSPPGDPAG